MLCQHSQFSFFEIFSPRYHDKTVLLAKHRVGKHNKIVFTKAPSMGEEPYYISGEKIKKAKVESNRKIDCYAVPINELSPLELEEYCEHLYK